MVTKAEIAHFYEKYKGNLKKEEQVTAELMSVTSQEEWVEKLKQRYRTIRQMYIENEALLNLYVRPFLEGRSELTEEAAVQFAEEIRKAWREGFEDNVSMLEMGEVVGAYLEGTDKLDAYIWDISVLGILYNNCMETGEGEKGYAYFKKVCALADRYFEIQDFEVRKRIIYAFYNRPILQVNFLLEDEQTQLRNLEEAMDFYRNPQVLALDGKRFDFEGLTEELNYDVYGNYVISHTRGNSQRWFLERGEQVLEGYYRRELAKNPDPCAMPDEIFCYYKRTSFFLGRISCTQFLNDYRAYCDYSLAHDTMEHPDGFYESRLFHVAVNHLPGILECLRLYGAEYSGEPNLRERCIRDYISVLGKMPRSGNSRFVNDAIQRSLHTVMESMTEDDETFDELLNRMLDRDEITLVHSRMVGQIAGLLLQEVLEKKPELLIGALGCRNVVEVLENREQLASFIAHAAKLFDIGKLKDMDLVNKQSRQLTKKELERIHEHPVVGGEMVKKSPSLRQFYDVVMGHHKSWDGFMGYPDFDNTASPNRFLIELIHVSDCLDAATDFIGRSYKVHKSLEECMDELRQGRGTIYCPELVDLMANGSALRKKLRRLLNQGRIQAYCEVYGVALEGLPEQTPKKEAEEWYLRVGDDVETVPDEKEQLISALHESSQANYSFVRAMVRTSLMTLHVDLRNGRYRVFSRGEQRLFGTIADGTYPDFLTRYLQKIVLPKDWEKLKFQLSLPEVIHALVTQEGSFECELRAMLQGSYRWVRLQFVRLDERDVIPRTMAVIFTDVQESHNHSDQMEAVLKDAYQTAVEASQAKSIFLRSMSHDIRTPMNGIVGMTQIALQHLGDAERVEECLRKIESSSDYLMRLLNEVLDMSRIESGNTILHEEPVVLRELLTEVLDVLRPEMRGARQELVVESELLEGERVMADPVRLRQVFTNILSNAVKYTPDGGRVRVRARRLSEDAEKGNCYQFRFEDNGIGMSEKFQKQMFEPFAREDNSMTNAKQGTGLGLSIAKAMVTKMGGTIEAESTQGVGTTVTVTLPLHPAEEASQGVEKPEEELRFDGHRILLVEDNELNREIACELLRDRGLTVETAIDGVDAVERFRASAPGYYELILMDIQMPRLNGYGATRAIRELPGEYAQNIPIVALTANIFQEDAMEAMESGMNAHIAKPIDMGRVSKTLRKWLAD